MLTGFSVSLAFFNDANLGLSVPLSFIPLAYLVGAARVHRPAPLAAAAAAAAAARPVAGAGAC